MNHITLKNGDNIPIGAIPVLDYAAFSAHIFMLLENLDCHCLNYYGYKETEETIRLICCIGNDATAEIHVFSWLHYVANDLPIPSLTACCFGLHIFEREISENFGIHYTNHPWDKPLRYPFDRSDALKTMNNYPFYKIESEELHEVGVGPIHAGIIEPGHFRFICNGEKVLHLEIHLGYQHRGIEELFIKKVKPLQRAILAESIAGDSVAANTSAHVMLMESLGNISINHTVHLYRCIAIELERAAMHTGDLSALCTDIAYQLGASVLQGLRTILINTFLVWCGNRFGRGLIRVGGNPYPINAELIKQIRENLVRFETRFNEMAAYLFNDPSVLARFEGTGTVSHEQARLIHGVGMAARTCGIYRDIRSSHPYSYFKGMKHTPVCFDSGDVQARAMLRKMEVSQSLSYIREMLGKCEETSIVNQEQIALAPASFCISMTEGWRGEHCHCAITDKAGNIIHYKIKDPSMHNWMALALAVRNNDISDFPVCNKSFNLSYCGYDL